MELQPIMVRKRMEEINSAQEALVNQNHQVEQKTE